MDSNIRRSFLWIIFLVSLLILFDNWQRAHGHASLFFPSPVNTQAALNAKPGIKTNDAANVVSGAATLPGGAPVVSSQKIEFATDVYQGVIDTQGATLSKLSLLQDKDQSDRGYVTLFDQTPSHTYLARTGLIGGDFPNHADVFKQLPGPTTLAADQNTLQIKFESPVKDGVKIVKTYTFTRGSYVISVANQVMNSGDKPVTPILYLELVRDNQPVETPHFSHTFIGPAVYTSEHHFQKMTFSEIDKNKEEYATHADNGWIALVQHYFATVWIPQEGAPRDIYVGKLDNNTLYRVGVKEPLPTLAPGQTEDVTARLFAGPAKENMLAGIAPGLDLVKDYGWFTIIAKPLFWLLSKIHSVLGNWGWSIIALTVLIKLVFFPLSAASYKSMARMKDVAPRVQTLRERFKDDPQKMNAAMMELYKTEKINPFGGCFPVVIQIPVFISLYWVLLSSVEMRGAPWALWIHDLSRHDPYYILPLLMAGSMFLQTRLSPPPPDPMQAKLMMIMPLAFSVMFFFFPSGLVLYYVVNNVLSIAQQYYITRAITKRS